MRERYCYIISHTALHSLERAKVLGAHISNIYQEYVLDTLSCIFGFCIQNFSKKLHHMNSCGTQYHHRLPYSKTMSSEFWLINYCCMVLLIKAGKLEPKVENNKAYCPKAGVIGFHISPVPPLSYMQTIKDCRISHFSR